MREENHKDTKDTKNRLKFLILTEFVVKRREENHKDTKSTKIRITIFVLFVSLWFLSSY